MTKATESPGQVLQMDEFVGKPVATLRRVRVIINALHAKSGGGITYLRNMLPLLAADERLEFHVFLHVNQFKIFSPIDERIRVHLFEFKSNILSLMLWEQISLPIMARIMGTDVTFSPANYGPIFVPAPVIVLRNALAVAGTERRPFRRLYWWGMALMTILSLLRCRKAIAVSEYAAQMLTFGLEKITGPKVEIVYHGIDPKFSPKENFENAETFILVVADIYVQKNLHTLIVAFEKVLKRYPHFQLLIAGRRNDRDYFKELTAIIKQRGLKDSIDFLGECSTDRLVKLYRDCTIFVFPSTVETFGNPLVEAMACGAPIASSNTAAMPEIVSDGAIMFDPLSPDEIAESIFSYLEDPALAKSMGAKGMARSKIFSWNSTANKTANILFKCGFRT